MSEDLIPEWTKQVYEILRPLPVEEQTRVISGTLGMLGHAPLGRLTSSFAPEDERENAINGREFGPNARRWLKQHTVTGDLLAEVVDLTGDDIVLIASDIPGSTMKEKTANCYLLVGVCSLLQNDEPEFTDARAVEFCRFAGAYDSNNHTANRKSIGNRISGDRKTTLKLTAPGLRDAATVIRKIATNSVKVG